jgi:hypothetical protein
MKNVTTQMKIFGLLMVIISGIACDKSAKRLEVTQRLARGQSVYMNIVDDQIGVLNINNTGYWGDVTGAPANLNQTQFEAQWKGLMAATMNPNQIGTISSFAGTKQGVHIQGGIRYNGAAISAADLATAQIRIAVWDSLAGTTDGSGKIIPEYPIHMIGAQGSVVGGVVQLTFADAYGTITLGGYITGGLLQGTLSFQNFTNPTGGALPNSGPLGAFTINVCDFFICN